KVFHSPGYELWLDRDDLLLKKKEENPAMSVRLEISTGTRCFSFADNQFEMTVTDAVTLCRAENVLQVDMGKLQFPLLMRFWEMGNYCCPVGMRGKRKKISDYFVQKKIRTYNKKRIPILVKANGDNIWIVGYRSDNGYRMTESTKKVVTSVRN